MLILKSLMLATSLMVIAFIIYLFIKNPSIVDVFWGVTIWAVASFFLFHKAYFDMPHIIIFSLLTIWMLRLSGYLLLTRIIPGHVDARYLDIANSMDSPEYIAFFVNYIFQAILAWLIASSFYYIAENNYLLDTKFYIITGFILFAIICETIADLQLKYFKDHLASNIHNICNIGFWKYSRHPNYFFEILIWLGFSFLAFKNREWLAFISPFTLMYIMFKFTIPITEERQLKNKGSKYEEYQQHTNMLWPLKL